MTDTSELHHHEKPVICIMGPTASGKTSLAIDLCQQLNGEIISVDSALIYRDMDIGTAKPSADELSQAKHHLIDICDPSESYSAAQFRSDALSLITNLYDKGKWPILAGGTMLYFKTLFQGMAELPATRPEVRTQVNERLQDVGIEGLYQWLSEIDPVTANRLHTTDTQRITRAIEVFLMSGKPLSEWHAEQQEQHLPFKVLQFALAPLERAVLHQRIEERFDLMLAQGFEQEVRYLYQRGDLNTEMPSIRCVGYRQMWSYLEGEYSLDEARFRGIVATRQLAKRQFTWLRSWDNLHWLDSLAEGNAQRVLKKIGNIAI